MEAVTSSKLPSVGHKVSTSPIETTGFGFAVIETEFVAVQFFESVTVTL